MKTLLIVESPNKVKTIKGYLGNNYLVAASVGHIRDLKPTELSIDIDNNFKETYEIIKDPRNPNNNKKKVVEQLQGLASKADLILLATDPDREGEAISWHLEHVLKKHNSNIQRVTFNEITKNEILKAVQKPREIDNNLVDAQRTRRILDRIVGFLVSGLLQKKIEGNLSAGRVQSAVLRLIKDRDDDINNFIPQEYWNIFANVHKENDEQNIIKAKLVKKDNNDLKINNKEEYENILNELNGATYIVDKIDNKTEQRKPQPPLETVTLIKQGYSLFRYDADKVMKIAQSLFEGIDVDGDRHGLITYMRTDSVTVSPDFQKLTLSYIDNEYGNQYVPNSPNIYKNKGDSQAAHECIRPTYLEYAPEKIKHCLSEEQYNLYCLIFYKFIASQMAHAIFDTVTLYIKANNFLFTEKGSIMKFDGFLKVNNIKNIIKGKNEEDEEDEGNDKDKLLPNVNEKEILDLQKLYGEQKFTQPPSYFDEGSLIEELKRLGIGRPSTFATIISTLKKREYIIVQKQKNSKREFFQITDLGKKVVVDLINYFTNLFNLDYTKQMEDFLDDVETGKKKFLSVLHEFYNEFKLELDNAYKNMPITKQINFYEKPCPKCNAKLILKKGKFGEYVECEKFPNCDFRGAKSNLEIEQSNITCPNCQEHKLNKRFNKKKQPFYSCLNEKCPLLPYYEEKDIYKDNCDKCGSLLILREYQGNKFYGCLGYYKEDIKCNNSIPLVNENAEKCPECGKPLIKRKGQLGVFYGCSGYPNCKYIKPDGKNKNKDKPKETNENCDKCGKPMVIRTNASDKSKKFLACTGYPNCKNTKQYNK